MTLNLFTNSNQLTDSLKIGAKSFFYKYKKGKRKEGHYGPKGGIKSLSPRQLNTQQSYTYPIFCYGTSFKACPGLAGFHHASPQAGLTELVGTEPTSRIRTKQIKQLKLEIDLDCRMRYCGSKHYCTLSHFFLVFGIVRKII